jgi:hypothetical protein
MKRFKEDGTPSPVEGLKMAYEKNTGLYLISLPLMLTIQSMSSNVEINSESTFLEANLSATLAYFSWTVRPAYLTS